MPFFLSVKSNDVAELNYAQNQKSHGKLPYISIHSWKPDEVYIYTKGTELAGEFILLYVDKNWPRKDPVLVYMQNTCLEPVFLYVKDSCVSYISRSIREDKCVRCVRCRASPIRQDNCVRYVLDTQQVLLHFQENCFGY